MTPNSSSKQSKKSRRIRRGIAAVVLAVGVGGIAAGPGVSAASATTHVVGGIFWR